MIYVLPDESSLQFPSLIKKIGDAKIGDPVAPKIPKDEGP